MIFTHCQEYELVMQELSAIVPARDKQTIIKTAISKVVALSNSVVGRNQLLSSVFITKFIYKEVLKLSIFYYVAQFRSAIQLQFDFHRAIYNLGTVLVCSLRLFDMSGFRQCCFNLNICKLISTLW
jgi:hypothetical protein